MGVQTELTSNAIGLVASELEALSHDQKQKQQHQLCSDTTTSSDESCALYGELSDGDSAESSRTDENIMEEDEDALILAAANAFEGSSPSRSGGKVQAPCFRRLRFVYLSVILVIYLADGMQGKLATG